MKILFDRREKNSGIKKELIKQGLEVLEKQLLSADFIIKTKTLDGKIITVGIEKKTMNDFLNSIIDKRIISQLIEMKRHFDMSLLIIEGTENIYELRDFHPNSIRGMLASIAIDFQTPILHTRNQKDTAHILAIIAKRLEKQRSFPSLLKKRKPPTQKQQQEYFVESLPGIGPITAKKILNKFGTIKNLINAEEKELVKIEKIGKIKASRLKELFERKYG